MMQMPPWLQYIMMSQGDKVVLPRTSYSQQIPRQISPDGIPGPRAGYQRPTPEGYRVPNPRQGYYTDPDAGIRGQMYPQQMPQGGAIPGLQFNWVDPVS